MILRIQNFSKLQQTSNLYFISSKTREKNSYFYQFHDLENLNTCVELQENSPCEAWK
jgi:hypothetical protein